MTEQIRLHRPDAPPTSDPGDHQWRSNSSALPAHAFLQRNGAPPRSACDRVRWTAAFGHVGTGSCFECVAALRDQLRAIVVALAKAGIHVDLGSAQPFDGYENRPDVDLIRPEWDAPLGAGESVEASRG